jgi:tRNA threonylcarbamoyl adenosine modification protein YjeE
VEQFFRKLKNEAATIALGRELSLFTKPGMVICLYGELGAGKSTLARAIIAAILNDQEIDIPSPTFTLVQPYDHGRIAIQHYDLYRTTDIDEIFELGLFDDQQTRVTLIEWPEKLGNEIPPNRIDITLSDDGDGRLACIAGFGDHGRIVERVNTIARFVESGKWQNATRTFLQGDASARRYEHLVDTDGKTAILMDMPEIPDGPIVANGKTYSQIAHIAEGILPVAAINNGLLEQGYSAPMALQSDLSGGLMIIENFGNLVFGNIIRQPGQIEEPLLAATQLLAHMTTREWPDMAKTSSGEVHHVPAYDRRAYKIEVALLLDWFWPLIKQQKADDKTRRAFEKAWEAVFPLFADERSVWVLRDFHSPNLIWLPERKDFARVGLIDTQDCVLGHPGYDLVSLLQDARVDLPEQSEAVLFRHYCLQRRKYDANFDAESFSAAYAGLGAHRATKILGIFARLHVRDGKPGYLRHLPRVSAALEKNLAHPDLAPLADWFGKYLPAARRSYPTEAS